MKKCLILPISVLLSTIVAPSIAQSTQAASSVNPTGNSSRSTTAAPSKSVSRPDANGQGGSSWTAGKGSFSSATQKTSGIWDAGSSLKGITSGSATSKTASATSRGRSDLAKPLMLKSRRTLTSALPANARVGGRGAGPISHRSQGFKSSPSISFSTRGIGRGKDQSSGFTGGISGSGSNSTSRAAPNSALKRPSGQIPLSASRHVSPQRERKNSQHKPR